ncbi:MAG: hypothetical protein NC253_07670 [Ruminococcus sp.]|nr:hypothetical protein [Ruminococcus sp.]MCM1479550.1 hypothetical protein [Muribaculaceae bacterium]
MEALQLKCPNCGAAVGFKPDVQKFVCDFCGSDFTEAEINSANETERKTVEQNNYFSGHTNLYQCQSCGAEIVSDENTAATFCHYCHGGVVLQGRVSGALQPELIIPFKYTRDLAEKAFEGWCAKKWFLPGDFTSKKQLEKMVGLYVPFWLSDCTVDSSVVCDAKNVSSHISGNYRITHTRVYSVERAAVMEYRGVPADGSKKLEDDLMDAIEPFDYSAFEPFNMNYFSGFYADKYDVDKETAFPRIKERMRQGAEQVLMNDINGYTSVSKLSANMNVKKAAWHYAMLPVWFMTYIHNGKKYFFALNGQTGKIAGIPPVSGKKLALLGAGLFLLFAIGGGLIGGMMV